MLRLVDVGIARKDESTNAHFLVIFDLCQHLIGAADFTLVEAGTGRTITTGRVEDFVGYSATGTTVATVAAQRDAQERLMTILADQIVLRLQAANL